MDNSAPSPMVGGIGTYMISEQRSEYKRGYPRASKVHQHGKHGYPNHVPSARPVMGLPGELFSGVRIDHRDLMVGGLG